MQVIGQASQRVAGKIEDLQRIGQREYLARELGEPGREREAPGADQLAVAQLLQCVVQSGQPATEKR